MYVVRGANPNDQERFRGYPTFVRKSFVFGEGQTP
jgi:hypothetical protein